MKCGISMYRGHCRLASLSLALQKNTEDCPEDIRYVPKDNDGESNQLGFKGLDYGGIENQGELQSRCFWC
jgi:hypothetical protein